MNHIFIFYLFIADKTNYMLENLENDNAHTQLELSNRNLEIDRKIGKKLLKISHSNL